MGKVYLSWNVAGTDSTIKVADAEIPSLMFTWWELPNAEIVGYGVSHEGRPVARVSFTHRKVGATTHTFFTDRLIVA